MEQKGFKISQYACAVLLIVSSIALVGYHPADRQRLAAHLLESLRHVPPLHPHRVLQIRKQKTAKHLEVSNILPIFAAEIKTKDEWRSY